MDLDVAGLLLALEHRPDRDVEHLDRPLALLDLPQVILVHHVGHLRLVLLPLDDGLLQVVDLLVHLGHVLVVDGPEREHPDKGRRGVLERRVLLLARDLTGRDEHEPEHRVLALFEFDHVLERVDVEGRSEAVDREDKGTPGDVDEDLRGNHGQLD